ncbi:MAG: MaoC family dehydratase N-terminal domain-containing protein [Pseudomonas sp.]|uniref:FAS1-like dehydratase domain-containing protein n=1 Tax=Pseudomonas sp. TaxID=306 RepID=UPI00398272DB
MTFSSEAFEPLLAWRGRREQRTEMLAAFPAQALSATLDRDNATVETGAALPPGYQWLYFLPLAAMAQVGADGHPARGGFLPPVPLPRRMWAAGRLSFHSPLQIDERVTRESEIIDIRMKTGRSGPLVFVTVEHRYLGSDERLAIVEQQDIVYREPAAGEQPAVQQSSAAPASASATWCRQLTADPVLLFRYSALTFNGHRIHYDRPYATEVEGYAGLVVHGPLVATLLLDLVRRKRPDAQIAHFEFRAMKPLLDGAAFQLCGEPATDGNSIKLWAEDAGGVVTMLATATLA